MAGNVIYKIHSGGSLKSASVAPSAPTNFTATKSSNGVVLKWTDPPATVYDDGDLVCQWAYLVVFRRTDRYPTSITDGTKIVQSSIRNQYQSSGYTNTTATSKGTTYYYSVFAVSTEGLVSSPARASVTIPASKVMTVIIDQSDSNPATCCSYADDAIGMPSGRGSSAVSEWQDFFGYKPCILQSGSVTKYLNPNNYAQDESGGYAAINGYSGDVMVEFPRRGLMIKQISGSSIQVSMTDDPSDPDFEYYAHSNGSTIKDAFYIGAYDGCLITGGLTSGSGQYIVSDLSLSSWETRASNKGSGYSLIGWYQWTYLQAMYLLQFKHLNSQTQLGAGATDLSKTGFGNTLGLCGSNSSGIKLFGLENLWTGTVSRWPMYVDGIRAVTGSPGYFKIAKSNFSSSASYGTQTPISLEFEADTFGGISRYGVVTEEFGFIPTALGGSSSTYYCDEVNFYLPSSYQPKSDYTLGVGGMRSIGDGGGMFALMVADPDDYGLNARARLMYV